jgi:hypothetical protein
MSFLYLKAWDTRENSGAVGESVMPSEKIDTKKALLIPSGH